MYRSDVQSPLEVQVLRGNFTESVHLVDAVVIDADGKTVASFGDANKITYPRSSIKMIQAFMLLEAGAFEKFNLTKNEVALACASHNGEPIHVDLVTQWHKKVGLVEDNLVCGAHLPYDTESAHDMIRNNVKPTRYHNNCSGKHSGILCGIMAANRDIKSYDKYDHWAQINLRKVLSNLSGLNLDKAEWGVDGCGIPSYTMSLIGMAKGMSALLGKNKSQEWNNAAEIICDSVSAAPYCVSGRNSLCTEVIDVTKGRTIVKAGAEGMYCGVIRDQGLSYTLKVRDGAFRAAEIASAAILQGFSGLTEEESLKLSRYTRPTMKNWVGTEVGKVIVSGIKI